MPKDNEEPVFDGEFYSSVGPVENIDIRKEVTFQPRFDYKNYFAELIFSVLLVIGSGFLAFIFLAGLLKTPLIPVTTFLLLLALSISLLLRFIFSFRWIKRFLGFNIFEDIPSLKINEKGLTFVCKKYCDFFYWERIQNITYKTVKYSIRTGAVYSVEYRILILYSPESNLGKGTCASGKEFEYSYFFYNDFSPYDFIKYLYDWKATVLQAKN